MKALAFCLALATASPAAAAWRRVDTPNFIVVGDVSPRDLRSIASRFEAFHEALTLMLGATTTSAPVPTVVVVFPNVDAFTPYMPGSRRSVAGYASDGRDVNYIGMMNAGDFTDRVIFHEYSHLVIANAVARAPLWVNEGLAEFYSTFHLMDGGKRAMIGVPILEHLRALSGSIRVPLADLLQVDTKSARYNEDSRAGDFYAESWALVHMLFTAQPSRVADINTYLRRVREGSSETQAWEQVFGTARTEEALRLYIKRPILNSLQIEFSEKLVSLKPSDTAMSAADVAAFLGALQLRLRGADAAAKLLEPALAKEPDNALALGMMAKIDLAHREAGAVEKRLMNAAAPNDWFAAYMEGVALSEAIQRERSGHDQAISKAAALLGQARRDHAELANVLAELVKVELERDTAPAASARADIERARTLAPGRVDYALTDAQLFAEAREFAKARAVLGPLMTPAYPEEVRSAARRLMGGLVDFENAITRNTVLPDRRSRSVAVPDGEAGRPRSGAAGGRFVPAYRTLQAGEQRLDGMLERIDCPAGKPAVFSVRGSNGVVQFEGSMADIEFLTYRDDLTGGVSCGPRDPIHVYLTWREATPQPRVVAVEFLPKE